MLIKLFKISFYLLFMLVWSPSFCATDPIVIDNQNRLYPLDNQCDSFHGDIKASEIPSNFSKFIPHNNQNLVGGVEENNIHWFRFGVKNMTNREVYLMFPNLRFSTIALYQVENNQLKLIETGGYDNISKKESIKTHQDIFYLDLKHGVEKNYVISINGFEGKAFWAEVGTDFSVLSQNHSNDLLEGFLHGGLLIVVIFQLSIFYITRQKDYLFLAIYLFFLFIQSLGATGHLAEFIPNFNYRKYLLLLPITSAVSFPFAYHFLDLKTYQNKVFYAIVGLFFIGYIFSFVVGLSGNTVLLFNTIIPLSLFGAIAYIYLGFRRLKENYKPATSFLLAYIPNCLAIIVWILFSFGVLEFSIFIENALLISFTIHGLMFSVAVAYKIKTYRDETEQLILEQRDDLEQKVVERTYELGKEKAVIEEQSEKLKMVMKELHHRVKNNLTIVSSLLELQSNRLHDETTIRAFQEGQQRIEAMSLIHQRLYKSDELTTINMNEYIHELTHNLMNAYGFEKGDIEIITNIEYSELDIDMAIPIGLILNELLTNTFKYAYHQTEKPQLIINLLNIKGLVLEVKDNGIGIDMEQWNKKTGSFGKRLITGLGEQLGGESTIESKNGTSYQLYIAE